MSVIDQLRTLHDRMAVSPTTRGKPPPSGARDEAAVQALMACYAPPNVNAPEGPALDHQWRCAVERAIRDEYAIASARVSPAPGG